jgi:hypothetical protein
MLDRKSVGDAWTAYETQIKELLALAPMEPAQAKEVVAMLNVQAGTAGTAETRFFALPVSVPELLPHAAYTPKHWMLSTSPRFTEELAAKLGSVSGKEKGMQILVNFPAVWDFADAWVTALSESPDLAAMAGTKGGAASPEVALSKKLISMLRVIGAYEASISTENGQTVSRVSWTFQDLK